MTGIILAAGMGERLGKLTKNLPKALIKICGKPLVSYAIDFLRRLGADKIIIIGGFEFDKLKKAVKKIDKNVIICDNKNYKIGNLYSLEKALECVNENFLLWHVDHIFPKSDAERVRNFLEDKILAFCDDGAGRGLEDEMKVLTKDSGKKLEKVSKKIKNYDLAYVGITYCPLHFLDLYKEALSSAKIKYESKAKTEDVMQIIANGLLADVFIADISGHKWFEIDYPQELEVAKKGISLNPDLYL